MAEKPVQNNDWTQKVVAKKSRLTGRWEVKLESAEGTSIMPIYEISKLMNAVRVAWNFRFQEYRRNLMYERQESLAAEAKKAAEQTKVTKENI